jgi:hypothetical protein
MTEDILYDILTDETLAGLNNRLGNINQIQNDV